jgi:hypothetical protein
MATLLTGDTPRPRVSERRVPETDDLILVVVEFPDQRIASFRRVLRPQRRTPLVVFGVDTGLTTTEPAELELLAVEVVVEGDEVVFDPLALAREYGREIPGITVSTGSETPGLPAGQGVVTQSQEEADLVVRMRAAGRTPAQIQTALDTIRNNRRQSSEALRRDPGVAYNSRPLLEADANWLRGTHGNVARIPEQVGARLRGRYFNNYRAFQRAVWRTVADIPELATGFEAGDLPRMRRGEPPLAPPEQQHEGQTSYILHHTDRVVDNPSRQYDMSTILIVTPRAHLDILGRDTHFGPRQSERKAIMTREEMIDAMRRVIEVIGTEEDMQDLLYQLKLAVPHARVTELIQRRGDLSYEQLVDEALQREREKRYKPVGF